MFAYSVQYCTQVNVNTSQYQTIQNCAQIVIPYISYSLIIQSALHWHNKEREFKKSTNIIKGHFKLFKNK